MVSFLSFVASVAVVTYSANQVACSEFHARTATVNADFHLYAYSLDSSRGSLQGLPVAFGDGIAYAGKTAPEGVTDFFNVTVSATTDSSSFTATPDNGSNFNATQYLYVDNSVSEFGAVGFSDANATNKNITGFGLYGAWVFREDVTGTIQMQWYVEETSTDDVWQLKWNNVGAPVTSGVPVSLRTQTPVNPKD